ncbi:signal-transducing histidine kinase [Halarchaeum acidiphilum MH1-52-1]|uniref:histidine kinase n=1 Tax=Halarchaeum acidiphilum MH1-52-1 TaxID=1261545 RepID=U2YCW4_9EURY|nr:sensor histidine kinase [Halarchaeum acidiphilum]GAD51471.1 signal-transducing histidine kinase [Halarchaeum acidiphilum MH1-52-1]
MKPLRLAATASLSLTGVVLLVPILAHLLTGPPALGIVLGVIGVLVSLGLVAVGAVVYRLDVSQTNAVRIAGWNFLGIVVLGVVFILLFTYRPVEDAGFLFAVALSAGAVAHVIIGVYDVRRIRAEELATERERLAVLNTLVRHNLRHEAQRLLFAVEKVRDSDPDTAGEIEGVAEDLSEMNENVRAVEEAFDTEPTDVDVAAMCRAAAENAREAYDIDVSLDVPETAPARAGDQLRDAIDELVENAVEHGGDDPTVEIAARVDGRTVDITVADDGPGIPESELELVTGEREITQLEHGSGLGLWLVRWITEEYDGRVTFGESDRGGAAVTLALQRA